MRGTLSFATAAMLAVGALAAPMPPTSKTLTKRVFTFQVPPRIGAIRNGAHQMAKTYAKYGWEIITIDPNSPWASILGLGNGNGDNSGESSSPSEPSSTTVAPAPAATSSASSKSGSGSNDAASATTVTVAASATSNAAATGTQSGDTGEVTASPEPNESEYLSPVTIGGQSLVLDFDTGSADLWVFSSDLPSSESAGHSTFNPSSSSTWSEYEGGSWKISYGDGSSASGTVGFDEVNIGGATATKQAVEIATAVSGSFVKDTNNDGLVGLGFSRINTVQPEQQKTFFENIMNDLVQPVFTANLEDNAAGSYTFGEIDTSQYSGDIHFTSIDSSNGFWQFDSNTYSIGGTSNPCETCSPAIADTGTSLILLDDDIVQAYYSQISSAQNSYAQGGYIYDCSDTLPSLGVAIGNSGFTATIQGSDMTFAEIGDGTCFGGLQSNQGGGLQIMGDMLLKHFFAVFDGGNESFGLAAKA